MSMSFAQKYGSDDKRNACNDYGVIESGIDVPGLGHDRNTDQWQQSAENSVTDMIG